MAGSACRLVNAFSTGQKILKFSKFFSAYLYRFFLFNLELLSKRFKNFAPKFF